MKFNPKLGDLVYFQWEDHCSYYHAGWEPVSDLRDRLSGSTCETVGFVVALSKSHLTTAANIAQPANTNPDASQISTRLRRTIMKGAILKRFRYE